MVVTGTWLVPADREKIYAIVSDFERMPEYFPQIAHAMHLLKREGNCLTLEAESASFGRFFPKARIAMTAELLPGKGYRCSTHNLTFHTRGEEQLLLLDDPAGTRIEYTYIVAIQNKWAVPLYTWLTRKLALPFWKRAFIDRLMPLVTQSQD